MPGPLRGVVLKESRIGGVVAITLPDVKEASYAAGISTYHVDAITHNQTRHLLTASPLLQTCLGLVDAEVLVSDYPPQLSHELTVLLIDVVHAAERDVVGITGVVHLEPAGKS